MPPEVADCASTWPAPSKYRRVAKPNWLTPVIPLNSCPTPVVLYVPLELVVVPVVDVVPVVVPVLVVPVLVVPVDDVVVPVDVVLPVVE